MFNQTFSNLTRYLLGAVLSGVSLSAGAATNEITAFFKPNPDNPMQNRFVNTTVNGHFCTSQASYCKQSNIFSLRVNMPLEQTEGGEIVAYHPNERSGAFLKAPSEWRSIQVSPEFGPSETVEIRIAGIGGRYNLGAKATDLAGPAGHAGLWGVGSWAGAPAPCLGVGKAWEADDHSIFMWIVPENAGACSTQAKFDIPKFNYRYIEFAYELRTPNPLTMRTGVYRGSIPYTFGPMMDFDFGDRVLPKDNLLMLDFTLDVQHSLKVEVPPGGNRVELLPQGGWQSWLQRNRKPERLFRDQTFNLSVSSQFKMTLECEHDDANTCALMEPVSGRTVPMNIAVSLPNGMTDASGQPVNHRPLLRDGSGTELFQPGHYVDRKPGTLHFEVAREDVEEMLDGDGKTYAGNVTVVWDSEV
ncbi:hypothetical protein [Pseudomonas sp. LT1P18]|uniref:hypothetical protein n=1 Tax=Pseudomonas arabinosi TaxID=3398357 RepID=UPI0039EE6AD6